VASPIIPCHQRVLTLLDLCDELGILARAGGFVRAVDPAGARLAVVLALLGGEIKAVEELPPLHLALAFMEVDQLG
jgi:hypothetical protein